MKKKTRKQKAQGSVLMAHMGAVHMEISGNREIILEGSRGILEYNDSSIKINAGKYVVSFVGRGLHIKNFNDCDLVIQGFVTGIEYLI